MLGGIKKYPYLCSAKKERDGLCHQRTKTLAGHRALSEFAKKETLRIVPQQFLTIKRDTVQLTYPFSCFWPYTIILLSLRYYYKHLYLICTC